MSDGTRCFVEFALVEIGAMGPDVVELYGLDCDQGTMLRCLIMFRLGWRCTMSMLWLVLS